MYIAVFPSELAASIIAGRDPSRETLEDEAFIPARRFGEDEEMGGTVLYMAGRAGAYNNGLMLVNDGGRSSVMTSTY
jgi:NAD(P)-dependent dehydrogenase (short-subunit alcohol dehydrogenase family)